MGICSSTNNKNKDSSNLVSKTTRKSSYVSNSNVNKNENIKTIGDMTKHQSIGGTIYPKGKSFLLRKVQGKAISTTDTLKRKSELYVGLMRVPEQGTYCAEFYIIDKGEKTKIASLQEQRSDNNQQVLFNSCIELDYYFERDQTLEIVIIHKDSGNSILIPEKVARIAGSMRKGLIINNPNNSGLVLELKMVGIKSSKKTIDFNICALDNNKNPISDNKETFILFKNFNDKQTWRSVYKSEESTKYKYDLVRLTEDNLYLGEEDNKFRIELYEFGNSYPIGCATVSYNDVISNECFVKCDGNNNVMLKIIMNITETQSFVDLLHKGLQISMVVGIDFTASNLDYKNPNSLHYYNGGNPTQYEMAIKVCSSILGFYDADQKFPVFGFGGVPEGKNNMHDVFPLSFSDDYNAYGIEQIIQYYKNAISKTKLSGPTNFSPMIKNLSNIAKGSISQGNLTYFTLMIITDGDICDQEETISAIVNASGLPISIIIIGVGNSGFEAMNVLDSDDMPLKDCNNNLALRDIVQFVPFNKYKNNLEKLSEEVLKELPGQIESFYRNYKF